MGTHTYAIADVEQPTFDDVASRLRAAGYGHAFHDTEEGTVIDMHGIAIRAVRRGTFTNKPDGSPRHPGTVAVLRHFRFEHLPPHLQAVSRPFGELAMRMADELPEGPDLTCGLRDLLAAKDNCVRARLP